MSSSAEFGGEGENRTCIQLQPSVIPWSLLNTMNYIVPPAEDKRDITLENSNVSNIGGKKSKEVIITKVTIVVTSKEEGGGVV